MKYFAISIFIILYSFFNGFSQTKYDIKEANPSNIQKKCADCQALIGSLPPEVTYGFLLEGNDIYFIMTDINYFKELFQNNYDGIAVDVVTKNQYPCGSENKFANSTYYRGELLPPIYYKDFKKNIKVDEYGRVVFKVAQLPKKYLTQEFETNILILKNKYACYYNNFFDIPQTRWELLSMDLYQDTITQNKVSDTTSAFSEASKTLKKTLRFIVLFEKGKSNYSSEDIKPIYDSLRLTDYQITDINIQAYSSVEGSLERNIELQNQRAKSIVKALQSFQNETINMKITASENWVEFLVDAKKMGYNNIVQLSKDEIKEQLNKKGLSKKMEPFLQNHRKAIIVLLLNKKTEYFNESNAVITSYFEDAIKNKSLEKAIELQQEIFSRIRTAKMDEDALQSI